MPKGIYKRTAKFFRAAKKNLINARKAAKNKKTYNKISKSVNRYWESMTASELKAHKKRVKIGAANMSKAAKERQRKASIRVGRITGARNIAIAHKLPRSEKQLAHSRRVVKLAQRASIKSPKRIISNMENLKKAHRVAHKTVNIHNGYCEICKKSCKIQKDHCHKTGKQRGKICRNCNLALGLMLDNPKTLRIAATYLEKHRGIIRRYPRLEVAA